MQSTDRAEFEAQMATLCAGFNVPVGERANAYWLGLSKMELVSFARVVIEALGPDGPDKIPTVGQCWAISKKMRAARYPPKPVEPEKSQWQGDHWDIEANHHLLNHVRKHPKKYAPDSYYDPEKRQAVPGPLTRAYTAIVVRMKNAWAEDMRADDKGEGLPIEVQQAAWADCMELAEEQIALQKRKAA